MAQNVVNDEVECAKEREAILKKREASLKKKEASLKKIEASLEKREAKCGDADVLLKVTKETHRRTFEAKCKRLNKKQKTLNVKETKLTTQAAALALRENCLQIAEGTEPPDSLFCPLTLEVMRDPVMDANGHTFERENIVSCLEIRPGISPLTNAPYPEGARLTANFALKDVARLFQGPPTFVVEIIDLTK
jgi:hypothetical protein